ncbi:hypothetical protein [Paenibacillus dendrobii]|uniref:hypothetical protein n=1 Tax=Paenibacillus dendrobii TaxID=2691084 RepID=UPI003C6DBDF3
MDLGIGRAPGTDYKTALALRRSFEPLHADNLQELLHELKGYEGHSETDPSYPFADIVAVPREVRLPPLWILSSSSYSAELAALEAINYSFAYNFNSIGAREAVTKYLNLYLQHHNVRAPA